jgi:hypothetical protein
MKQTDLWVAVNTNPDFFPNQNQELLLHAALDDKAGAMRAWETWKSRADIERLDVGSHRLLPLLYRNMLAHGMDDQHLPRIKGVYRRAWYENQLLFGRLARFLSIFRQAGIKTMVLKGAALSLGYYRDGGVRPMDDFDILVPKEDGERGFALMRELGCRLIKEMPNEEILEANQHAWQFKDESGYNVDLHGNVLFGEFGEAAADDFWCRAVPVQVQGENTVVLSPEDQLLHVCSHGAEWNQIPPIRWVADAITVLRASGREIDWSRLLQETCRTHQTLALADTLRYLRDQFGILLPVGFLHELERTPPTYYERLIYRTNASVPAKRGLARGFVVHFLKHVNRRKDINWRRDLADFPAFLRKQWKLVHTWEIPGYIISHSATRIWRRVSGL